MWPEAIVIGILGIVFYMHQWGRDSFNNNTPVGKYAKDFINAINLFLVWLLSSVLIAVVQDQSASSTSVINMLNTFQWVFSIIIWIFITVYVLSLLFKGIEALRSFMSSRTGERK